MNTNTQALRECPFCGHLPDPENYIDSIHPLNREKTLWTAGCVDNEGGCNASSLGGSREEAIDNWNRRVSNPPAPEQASGEVTRSIQRDKGDAWRDWQAFRRQESEAASALTNFDAGFMAAAGLYTRPQQTAQVAQPLTDDLPDDYEV